MSERKHSEKGRNDPLADEVVDSPAPAGVDTPAVAQPPEAERLAVQVAQIEKEKAELRETLIRRQADFENFRKRIERERGEEGRRAIGHFLHDVLPVLDNFERALAAHDDPAYEEYRRGFELIYRQLWDVLAREGLQRIEAVGQRFDPHLHHALERVETEEHAEGTVLEMLQPGYTYRGKVLRAAIVRVAVPPAANPLQARGQIN